MQSTSGHPVSVPLAFGLLYISWGTTFLAIRFGVQEFPPALFSGTRVVLAGLLILGYLRWRGEPVTMSRQGLWRAALVGCCFFMGGNFLITLGLREVPAGFTAVMAASTTLWMALLETFWPWGERLNARGWSGIVIGLGGVVILMTPKLAEPHKLLESMGPFFVLGSAFVWAIASFLSRRLRQEESSMTAAAYQMLLGGAGLTLLGLTIGELGQLRSENFTPLAVFAFFHLLVAGSLVGFVAYTYLLAHVSASQAGTYAYVCPMITIVVGWLLAEEAITVWIIGGMITILTGVALVRAGTRGPAKHE